MQSDKKTIIQHEDEAFIVRRIYSRYATGTIGVRSLRDELTGDGHWKRTGKPWTVQTLLHMLRNPVYTGKIRWKTALHAGIHEPIVEQETFNRVQEVLKDRADDLKGRQWHTNSERLATGVIFCGLCGKTMVGVSATKSGRKLPYYVCNGRLTKSGCRMDYIRADRLEAQIISDFSGLFRTRGIVERLARREPADRQGEAGSRNRAREGATGPRRRGRVPESLLRRIRRWLHGPEGVCSPGRRPETPGGRPEGTSDAAREQLARLQLPAIDLDEVQRLMDDFERQFASNSNPERKHLLHRLVKEVRVQSKDAAEVWYAFPRPRVTTGPFVDSPIWLGAMVSLRLPRRILFSSRMRATAGRRGWGESSVKV